MRLFVTYLLITTSLSGFSNSLDEANELYKQDQFKEAVDAYSSIIANGDISADLFYNLGNAYYRIDEKGKSIWAYESALNLDPDHEDALFNLSFVNAQTVDKIDKSRKGLGHWFEGIVYSEAINFWAYLSIACSILLALFTILFIRSASGSKRNFYLLFTAILIIGLMSSVTIASLHRSRLEEKNFAIVITETAEIKMSPLDTANSSFSLGAGAKIEIIAKENGWIQIEINGNKGWVSNDSVWEL